MYDQNTLRRRIRAQRRSLSHRQQKGNALAAGKLLANSQLFRNSRNVAIYIENDGEIGASHLLATIRRQKKRCYLPALRPMLPNRLWFAEFRIGDRLSINRYGIPEPDVRKRKPISPQGLDLIIVPLVAFDRHCNRLGMGGGFYDRTLSYLAVRNKWHKPRLIGFAHDLQRVHSIQTNPWDISLDGVVTESNFYRQTQLK